MRTRRALGLPALVMLPRRTCSPVERSEHQTEIGHQLPGCLEAAHIANFRNKVTAVRNATPRIAW